MSEIRSQATPARDGAKNELATAVLELLNRAAQAGTPYRAITAHVVARGLSADGWSKRRTVDSAAELEALPVGSVVRVNDANDVISHVCLRYSDGWFTTLHESMVYPLAVTGSATVLFTPGDA